MIYLGIYCGIAIDAGESAVPIVGTAHNALDDARNIKARHDWLRQRCESA